MRTEHKIGIAVSLFVIGVIVAYSVFSPGEQQPESTRPDVPSPDSERTAKDQDGGSFYSAFSGRVDGVIPGLGNSIVGKGAEDGSAHTDGSGDDLASSDTAGASGAVTDRAGTTTGSPGSAHLSGGRGVGNPGFGAESSAGWTTGAGEGVAAEGWPTG